MKRQGEENIFHDFLSVAFSINGDFVDVYNRHDMSISNESPKVFSMSRRIKSCSVVVHSNLSSHSRTERRDLNAESMINIGHSVNVN